MATAPDSPGIFDMTAVGCSHSTTVRPCWDCYFLEIAQTVAARADCRRRQYGAVIVRENRVISTGYNGAPPGEPGCLAGACPRGMLSYTEVAAMTDYEHGPGRCISIHAEANALLYSSRSAHRGGTMYVTGAPCSACSKLIAGSGLARVVWPGEGGRLDGCEYAGCGASQAA